MVLIDVFVPSLNRDYDFRLNENLPVGEVMDEIVELICQKERCGLEGNKENFMLCNARTGDILPVRATLAQEGVVSGTKLFLV